MKPSKCSSMEEWINICYIINGIWYSNKCEWTTMYYNMDTPPKLLSETNQTQMIYLK